MAENAVESRSRLTIAMPALNEAGTIGSVVSRAKAMCARVIVIDGGSEDGTAEIAIKAGADVLVEKRRGVGIATKRAIAECHTEYMLLLDADGTYFPEGAGKALDKALGEGLDAVFGDRFGFPENTMRATRRAGNFAINVFLSALFLNQMPDSQSGFFLIRKETFKRLPESGSFPFVQALKLAAISGGKKIAWIPIRYTDREKGSKFRFFADGFSLVASALAQRLGRW